MSAENNVQQVWDWLADVPDPEIPVVSVVDLGIVRNINIGDDTIEVEVAPTYSGCPATEVIESSILEKLVDEGLKGVSIKRVLSPPWTTDWITESGRGKLRDYGIAPPVGSASKRELLGKGAVHCPRCGTSQTTVVSEFGSTACKALYQCAACGEPFDHFKPI